MNIVIIGNGAAGLSAVKTFRKYDKDSKILLITKEGKVPYSRVLLPYVLRKKIDYENIFLETEDFYKKYMVDCIEDEVISVNENEKKLILKSNKEIQYDKVLIATGAYAVAPQVDGLKGEGIYHMWTKSDLNQLITIFEEKQNVVVLGSGFIALQAAWTAKVRGLDVTVIEIMDRIMPTVLDKVGSEILRKNIIDSGVKLYTNTVTEKVYHQPEGKLKIYLKNQESIETDFIIVGTGVRSNLQFLEDTSIKRERAILVDQYMNTNVEDIYAAGDVAAGPTVFGHKHLTHALWPTAVEMGQVAGANMAGKSMCYSGSLNMNVTQMFNTTVASIGLFNDEDIDNYYVYDMEKYEGYIKICYKNELVVGACLIGQSESVKLLGKLRPLIRKKLKADCSPEKLERYLEIKIFKDRF